MPQGRKARVETRALTLKIAWYENPSFMKLILPVVHQELNLLFCFTKRTAG
jgi:hypothetical protein